MDSHAFEDRVEDNSFYHPSSPPLRPAAWAYRHVLLVQPVGNLAIGSAGLPSTAGEAPPALIAVTNVVRSPWKSSTSPASFTTSISAFIRSCLIIRPL